MKITLQSRTEKHVEIYFEKTRDAEIQRMLPQASTTLEEALDSFQHSVAPGTTSYGRTIYADGVYVGDIWCYCISENESPNAMVSYCIFEKQYWRRGVATCALKLFLSEIAEKFRLRQIGAFTFADNEASIKVLEANGFVCTERFTENDIESVYYQLQSMKMNNSVKESETNTQARTVLHTQIPIIENDRIALLPYTHDDDADMVLCWKDIGTQRGYNNILDENCEQFFAFEISQFPFWVTILDKQTNCKVGSIRLGLDETPDLAIWIYPKYRSMGYGTESFRMSLKYLFAKYQYSELSAGCYIDNEKSLRMLKRIGFTRVPLDDIEETNCFTGEPTKMLAFKITADQIND